MGALVLVALVALVSFIFDAPGIALLTTKPPGFI